MKTIYADHAATTPLSENVLKVIEPLLRECYGNPSSLHTPGREARKVVEDSRRTIANAFGAKAEEICFTSGGSESNNWAIKGIMERQKRRGKNHIITTNIEHPSVLLPCEKLEAYGCEVTYLPVDREGYVTADQVKDAIRDTTALISVMFANNEIGTIQPIWKIGAVCKAASIPFHTDAVQAVGNIEIDVAEMGIDLMTISGHKIQAMKGVGALYIRDGIEIDSLIDGGSQESGRRAGTENVIGIASLAQAVDDAVQDIYAKVRRVTVKRDYLIERAIREIPGCRLNGGLRNRLCGNISLSFEDIDGESLILSLDREGIYASTGSACMEGSLKPSHVLKAIRISEEEAQHTIRLSVSQKSSKSDIIIITNALK